MGNEVVWIPSPELQTPALQRPIRGYSNGLRYQRKQSDLHAQALDTISKTRCIMVIQSQFHQKLTLKLTVRLRT